MILLVNMVVWGLLTDYDWWACVRYMYIALGSKSNGDTTTNAAAAPLKKSIVWCTVHTCNSELQMNVISVRMNECASESNQIDLLRLCYWFVDILFAAIWFWFLSRRANFNRVCAKNDFFHLFLYRCDAVRANGIVQISPQNRQSSSWIEN